MTAHDARDYRERAEELRTNADNMVSQECARQLRRLADDYDRMATRRETALVALAPFARLADKFNEHAHADEWEVHSSPRGVLRLADLRRAREAHALITEALQRGEK